MAENFSTLEQNSRLHLPLFLSTMPVLLPYLPILQRVKPLTYEATRGNIHTTKGPLLTPVAILLTETVVKGVERPGKARKGDQHANHKNADRP